MATSEVQPGSSLHLAVAGRVARKRDWVDRRFNLHAIGYVVAGRGTYRVGEGPVQVVGPGTLFSVYPGPHFSYGPTRGTTWDEFHVGATGPGVARWRAMGWLPEDGMVVRTGRATALDEAFAQLLAMRKLTRWSTDARATERVTNLAERVLIEAKAARLDATAGPADEVRAVVDALRRRFAEVMDFEQLATEHGMSYSKLRQGVRRLTGHGPAGFVTRLRCEAAGRILRETDTTVRQVGAAVGIENPHLFSRVFRKQVGLSPKQYREQTSGFGPARRRRA